MSSTRSLMLCLFVFVLTLISISEARRVSRTASKKATLSDYTVPLSNGSASLTPPALNLKLKAITLGRGTQNYTCASESSTPVAVGAKAELLDASAILPHLPKKDALAILNQLPSYLVNYDFDTVENSTIPKIGSHIFTADKVPRFYLGDCGTFAGKKTENISAPAADNAVDWLRLDSVEGSVKLSVAYRVHTAGGRPPKTCKNQPSKIEIPYASHYWFYG